MEVNEAIELISQLLNTDWDNDVDENGRSYKKTREDLISLLKSLESENKKLKQENEAYKGIVGEIENDFGNGILQNENGFGVKLEHLVEIKKQKFFGGGK